MKSGKQSVRETAKSILNTVGLIPLGRRIASAFRAPSVFTGHEQRFDELKRKHAKVLGERLNNNAVAQEIALVVSPGFPEVEIELGLVKALQLGNYIPVVIIPYDGPYGSLLAEHYRLAAVDKVHLWNEFIGEKDHAAAEAAVSRCKSVWDLLEFEHFGVRVGRLAVSTVLRYTYKGFLDLQVSEDRRLLVDAVAQSMACANAAQEILKKFQPDVAMFVDTVYSPTGELFDSCLLKNVEAIQWQQAHKSNALIFKRYNRETWLLHPSSISPDSWRSILDMEWTEDHRKRLHQDLYSTYASGDWYSVVGTQFDKTIVDAATLRERFGLDPSKKTAIIFPHILWDATLFWVKCLFRDYEEWFLETVRAACTNNKVNWVIKIHPANRRLREDGSLQCESAEVESLNKHIGKLPSNIVMIPPESEISTYSLFQIMDVCVTVCGTVGIETARLGIPVLTAGKGPYDSLGFTVDSNTREEYLEKVRNIQDIPRISPAQQELAERFAYAHFLMRPWQASSITLRYLPATKKFSHDGQVNIRSREEWYKAEDLRAFAEWVSDPNKRAEFLAPLPQPCSLGQ